MQMTACGKGTAACIWQPAAAFARQPGNHFVLDGHPASCSALRCSPHALNVQASTPPFKYLSFKVIGERIPLAAVQVRLFPDADWLDMARSGADYWQIIEYASVPKELTPDDPLDFKITCADGNVLTERVLVPSDMFCSFQDPACKYHTGTVQC